MKISTLILLAFLSAAPQSYAGMYSGGYIEERRFISKGVKKYLHEKDVCVVFNNGCNANGFLYITPSKKSIYITLYKIDDLNIAKGVFDVLCDVYIEGEFNTTIYLNVYSASQKDTGLFFFKEKPILNAIIQGEE
ncbi:MAG: hypothetical protein ACI9W6_002390 [Motiliproteus sp.]|jgi:hypothetical protein